MSSQKLSCGMLETQPLSEPLEPLPDMQCDDSELSVAGEERTVTLMTTNLAYMTSATYS